MKKYKLAQVILLLVISHVSAAERNEITDAIRYAYNLRFDKAEEIISKYIKENPDNLTGYAGRAVYDFLVINQNPDQENIDTIFKNLREFEEILDNRLSRDNSVETRFYKCFADYYFMKSYALNRNWISSFRSASRSRSLALELKEHIDILPDLYFILGDQDYTASLVPSSLEPLMRFVSFSPDRAKGLRLLEKAMEHGVLTRHEARMFYISSMIYVEGNFKKALELTDSFLEDFPENLTAVFYRADILLRKGRIIEAVRMLDRIDAIYIKGGLAGKWLSKYHQDIRKLL